MSQEDREIKFISMPRYQMRRHALKKLLKKAGAVGSGKKIYEIGYGAGEIFRLYKEMGLRVHGYDFSEYAYKYASQNYQDDQIVLFQEKPKPQNQYDFVVACEVLEHIEDDLKMLKEWKSYLKNRGTLIISVPAHRKRWGAVDVYAGHYRRYERKELEKKLAKAGLKIEEIYTYDFPECLLLDRMRDNDYGRKMEREKTGKSKEEYTKRSGIEREFSPLIQALANPAIWTVVAKVSELFYHTDWGSGYILAASAKRQEKGGEDA